MKEIISYAYDKTGNTINIGLGRFLQADPVGFKGDASNLYRYCHNDPADFSDPTGLVDLSPVSEIWQRLRIFDTASTALAGLEDLAKQFNQPQAGMDGGGGGDASGNSGSGVSKERSIEGRHLTGNEIREARTVFGRKIDYDAVQVINGKYVPTQSSNYAVTPNNNIYYPKAPRDFTKAGGRSTLLFIHEMTHIMQHQHGVDVLGKGLVLQSAKFLSGGLYDPYRVNYDGRRPFSSYNIEQQGEIAKRIYSGELPNTIVDYPDLR